MSELILDVQIYGDVEHDGSLVVYVEIGNADHCVSSKLDLVSMLADIPGHYTCGRPASYKTQKTKKSVEVHFNNFERYAKHALKVARKEHSRYKTAREVARTNPPAP